MGLGAELVHVQNAAPGLGFAVDQKNRVGGGIEEDAVTPLGGVQLGLEPALFLEEELEGVAGAGGGGLVAEGQPAWRSAASRASVAASHLAVAALTCSVMVLSSMFRRWKRLLSA